MTMKETFIFPEIEYVRPDFDKIGKAAEELAEKYHAQLDYYARALERMTGRRVKEKIIYSFALKEEITL